MDKLKELIQLQLIANIIKDKCAHNDYLIFSESWCSQERVIRFTTGFFREIFSFEKSNEGKWKTGDSVMYEANNNADSFVVNCVLNINSVPYESDAQIDKVLKATNVKKSEYSSDVILKSWNLSYSKEDVNNLFDDFEHLIQKEIPNFEKDLKEKLEKNPNEFTEGQLVKTTLSKYERNAKARAACLAANGTACKVCGLDFEKEYGPEFAGKIEVHHIIPISEIGKEYVIDPVKDLVPVCPNCHTALHSKKDGVYTVAELIALRKNHNKK